MCSESEREAAHLAEQLRAEKHEKKKLEAQIHSLKEDLTDLKASNENMQKVTEMANLTPQS